MAKEFTNLIVMQRGYQASSKVITTMDEISQEMIALKR
jgi:flagellar hook protein FlgE